MINESQLTRLESAIFRRGGMNFRAKGEILQAIKRGIALNDEIGVGWLLWVIGFECEDAQRVARDLCTCANGDRPSVAKVE